MCASWYSACIKLKQFFSLPVATMRTPTRLAYVLTLYTKLVAHLNVVSFSLFTIGCNFSLEAVQSHCTVLPGGVACGDYGTALYDLTSPVRAVFIRESCTHLYH